MAFVGWSNSTLGKGRGVERTTTEWSDSWSALLTEMESAKEGLFTIEKLNGMCTGQGFGNINNG